MTRISPATQWLIHGAAERALQPFFSRKYTEQKKKRGENVHYLEISTARHGPDRSSVWRLAQDPRHGATPSRVVNQSNDCFTRSFSTPALSSSIQKQCGCTPRARLRFYAPHPERNRDHIPPSRGLKIYCRRNLSVLHGNDRGGRCRCSARPLRVTDICKATSVPVLHDHRAPA